jgi:hypothetical protein
VIKVNLLTVDTDNIDHVNFLYEVIKYRWEHHDITNIPYKVSRIMPTFDEHQNAVKSKRYKHHYIIRLGDVMIGSCYIDHEDVYGIFLLPKYVKQALKKHKKKNTELVTRPEPLSVLAFKVMILLHPEIKTFYAKVNPKNTLSRSVMIRGGHQEEEIILSIKSVDGRIKNGLWPD